VILRGWASLYLIRDEIKVIFCRPVFENNKGPKILV